MAKIVAEMEEDGEDEETSQPRTRATVLNRDREDSNNDYNVLSRSHIFDDIIRSTGPHSSFKLNEVSYKHGYYLGEVIYPSYMAIVKTIPEPGDEKTKKFAKCQESARKDVERLFSVIKIKWVIIQQPAHAFEQKKLRSIMYACLILHNLIIEDDGRAMCVYDPNDVQENVEPVDEGKQQPNLWALRSKYVHGNLCADFIDYI
ncbi:uncharacterized protein LOC110890320 [Helianthus annuus]|uniref:uncharacterized protein LOC110890320 n=1 Tax=Helianthus annuus TaxID=4232 RepID=UPI000B8F19C8|nr:uncharacterized protein LOC110890320 [Helianthus annuus]